MISKKRCIEAISLIEDGLHELCIRRCPAVMHSSINHSIACSERRKSLEIIKNLLNSLNLLEPVETSENINKTLIDS